MEQQGHGRPTRQAAPATWPGREPARPQDPGARTGVGTQAGSTAKEFFTGVGMLFRGLKMYARSPRLVVLGIVPAVISATLVTVALGTLLYFIDDVAAGVTWFADDWDSGNRSLLRAVAGIAVVGVAGLVAVLTFTALTLLIGDPFYEEISKRVEDRFGGVPGEVEVPWYRSLGRSLKDSLRLVAMSVALGIPLFVAGFVPVVGQTVVPVIGAVVGGWLLAVELVGVPFQRRGLRLRDRRQVLKGHRPLALGFGVSVFVVFLIPLGAILVMPAAVAGATLLSRRVMGLPHT